MTEQQPQAQRFEGGPEPEQEQQLKTIAVRVEEGLHAQLRFIAQLNGSSLSEEIRTAIQTRIASAQDDPELIARAQQAREEIERKATARAATIAGFMGKPAVGAVVDAPDRTAPRARRSSKTSNE